MNMTPSEAVKLVETLKPLVQNDEVDVVFGVPAIDIVPVVEACKGTNIAVAAENMYFEEKVLTQVKSLRLCWLTLVLNTLSLDIPKEEITSEKQTKTLTRKYLKLSNIGITPIMCCGDIFWQREQGITMDWIRQQVKVGLQNVTADQAKTMVIAYEPIWAIGTGKTATSEQAQEICKGIRDCVAEIYDTDTAAAIRIQYGGSVNAGNAAELFAMGDIDGGLVGGASLKPDFGKIVNYK